MVLKDIDRKHLGVALDLRHLRAEIRGAYGNAIEAVRDKLVSVFVKDTSVVGDNRGKIGSRKCHWEQALSMKTCSVV